MAPALIAAWLIREEITMSITRRNFARALALLGGSAALPTATAPRALAQTPSASPVASPAAADPLALVNPELRPALEAMQAMMPAAMEVSAESLPAIREQQQQFTRPPLPEPPVTEQMIPGPAGAPDVPIYIINASPGEARPVVLSIFGGGFVLGNAAAEVPTLQVQAQALDCVVVAPDYRLAPETPFPGSLEDNYAALTWLYAHAEEIGADPDRIAVQGGSAGGGHAAMLAIAARDRGEVPIIFQSLIYPMLDDRTGSTRQLPPYIGAFIWTAESNRFGWSSLLGVPAGSADVPAGAVPARVEDLAGLPPTWIGVGSIDLFVDEDIEYARRLILAGVPTELVVVPGAVHGFQGIAPEARISQQFVLSQLNALASAFGEPPVTEYEPPPGFVPE
jgi:acetyl esterase/lipase